MCTLFSGAAPDKMKATLRFDKLIGSESSRCRWCEDTSPSTMSPALMLASRLSQVLAAHQAARPTRQTFRVELVARLHCSFEFQFRVNCSQIKEHKLTKESCGLHPIGGGVDTLFYCGYQVQVDFPRPGVSFGVFSRTSSR